jgi:DNA modification methylase
MAKLVMKARHRLMCGDSTSAQDVAKLMASAVATFVFTSPPYAQQRDYGAAKEKVGDWDALMQGVFAAAPVTVDAQLLVNLGLVHRDGEWMPYWEGWVDWMRAQGWRRFGWYIWDQGPGLPGDWNGRLAPSHEFIFHFNRQPRKPNKTVESKHAGETLGGGGLRGADGTVHRKTGYGNAIQSHRIPDSVFRIMRHKGGLCAAGSHPAVFPTALVEEVFAAFTDPEELVFEPFCGSGTQVIAAEKMGRRCFGMEIDPTYVDVACRRWLHFTGAEPVHEATGKTFSEMIDGKA